jgi:hypothetical protein
VLEERRTTLIQCLHRFQAQSVPVQRVGVVFRLAEPVGGRGEPSAVTVSVRVFLRLLDGIVNLTQPNWPM